MLFNKELFSGDTVVLDFCCDKDEDDDDEVLWRVIKLSKLDISSSEFAVVVVVVVGVVLDDDLDDLDMISASIAERDYYQNTNK